MALMMKHLSGLLYPLSQFGVSMASVLACGIVFILCGDTLLLVLILVMTYFIFMNGPDWISAKVFLIICIVSIIGA